MSVIDTLLRKYTQLVSLPWVENIAGQERVWMLVYPPRDERRLRAKVTEFDIVTKQAGHDWDLVDLTDEFAHWMSTVDYRESYFEHPEDMKLMLTAFGDHLTALVVGRDAAQNSDAVLAMMGLGGVEVTDLAGTNLAYDIHVRRVFLRSGLAIRDDQAHMLEAARRLNPGRPGALDGPAWAIGREWCHPSGPNCRACPLSQVCRKLITLGDGVRGA